MRTETNVSGFGDSRRRLWAKECGRPLVTTKGKGTGSPLEAPEGTESCQHLDFSPERPISDLWPLGENQFVLLKPLSLRQFVTAARRNWCTIYHYTYANVIFIICLTLPSVMMMIIIIAAHICWALTMQHSFSERFTKLFIKGNTVWKGNFDRPLRGRYTQGTESAGGN